MHRFLSAWSISICLMMFLNTAAQAGGIPEPGVVLYGKVTEGKTLVEQGEIEATYAPVGGEQTGTVKASLHKYIGSEPDEEKYSYRVKIPVETVLPGMNPTPGILPLCDSEMTYTRTITITAGENSKVYTDTVTLAPGGQRGATERRDYNIKHYTAEEIIPVILGIRPNDENIDPNGDQVLDTADLIYIINEGS